MRSPAPLACLPLRCPAFTHPFSPLLEAGAFLMRNYGRGTLIATLLAHIA